MVQAQQEPCPSPSLFYSALVVHANFSTESSNQLLQHLGRSGIYCGLAGIICTPPSNVVYPMVASLGWNPFYQNMQPSFEVHLIGYEGPDFYGERLAIRILHFLRPEQNYSTSQQLAEAIKQDMQLALSHLALRPALKQEQQQLLDYLDSSKC